MDNRHEKHERRKKPGYVGPPEARLADELAKRAQRPLQRKCRWQLGGTPNPIRNHEAEAGNPEPDHDEGHPPTLAVDQPPREQRHQERTEPGTRQGDSRRNPAIAIEPGLHGGNRGRVAERQTKAKAQPEPDATGSGHRQRSSAPAVRAAGRLLFPSSSWTHPPKSDAPKGRLPPSS